MNRPSILALVVANLAFSSTMAVAAAGSAERVRGTVTATTAQEVTVDTDAGKTLPIALTGKTVYLQVLKSSLDHLQKGSFIGTATKDVGGTAVALEVVIFPPAMRGVGEGHYAWDKIPDTTLAGGAQTSSAMTNGNVAAVSSTLPDVKSGMTNGDVAAAQARGGVTHLVVTYKGGKQDVLVPPTAPIVTFAPGTQAMLTKGSAVFIRATKDASGLVANAVVIGTKGVKPPM